MAIKKLIQSNLRLIFSILGIIILVYLVVGRGRVPGTQNPIFGYLDSAEKWGRWQISSFFAKCHIC